MIHVREQLDLAQSPLRINPVIKRIRDSLNRHLLLRLRIGSRAAAQQNNHRITQTTTNAIPNRNKTNNKQPNEVIGKFSLPNESVSAAADGSNRRRVFGGDLEEVAEDVVLNETSAMNRNASHLNS